MMGLHQQSAVALLYKRLIQLGKIAGALTFLFGIPYGIFEYIEKQRANRIEQTLSFYKQFNSAPVTSYREEVSKALVKNKAGMAAAAKSEAELKTFILQMVEKEDIEKDLLLIMDFFDGVVVCVIKDICDADTAEKLFALRAQEIYFSFYQYIQVMRQTSASKTFAIGLQTVATPKRK